MAESSPTAETSHRRNDVRRRHDDGIICGHTLRMFKSGYACYEHECRQIFVYIRCDTKETRFRQCFRAAFCTLYSQSLSERCKGNNNVAELKNADRLAARLPRTTNHVRAPFTRRARSVDGQHAHPHFAGNPAATWITRRADGRGAPPRHSPQLDFVCHSEADASLAAAAAAGRTGTRKTDDEPTNARASSLRTLPENYFSGERTMPRYVWQPRRAFAQFHSVNGDKRGRKYAEQR